MLVFVDEAGDTGLKLGQGSSPFFIITLVVFEHDDEAVACDQGISQLRQKLGLSNDFEFHFRETSRRLKKLFFEAVAPYRFFYVSFIINKQKLFGETFKAKNSFYKYACSLVFDNVKQFLERAIVVFDSSGSRQFKHELASYLRHKINDASAIRIQKVKMQDSKKNNLIQLVDMICGALNLSVKSPREQDWEYRRIITHKEFSTIIWPEESGLQKHE